MDISFVPCCVDQLIGHFDLLLDEGIDLKTMRWCE
jgi:hypothetical protein